MKLGSISISNIFLLCMLISVMTEWEIQSLNKNFPKDESTQTKAFPDTAFAFDLHGVIFTLDPIIVFKELMKSPKTKLFSAILYPRLLLNSLYMMHKGEVAEEVVLSVEKQAPELKDLIGTGLRIINAQRPIPETVNLIKKLKENGHKIYIFSNIGEQSIAMLAKRYPDIFSLFDGISATSRSDNYIKKPDPKSYEKFLAEFGLEKSKVIFVDDKLKNIKASISFGMPAVIFTTSYNLCKQLNLA